MSQRIAETVAAFGGSVHVVAAPGPCGSGPLSGGSPKLQRKLDVIHEVQLPPSRARKLPQVGRFVALRLHTHFCTLPPARQQGLDSSGPDLLLQLGSPSTHPSARHGIAQLRLHAAYAETTTVSLYTILAAPALPAVTVTQSNLLVIMYLLPGRLSQGARAVDIWQQHGPPSSL